MYMLRSLLLLLFFFTFTEIVNAQNLYSLHTEWDDDIKQWIIKCDGGELEGSISMRWRLKNDITQWDFRIGTITGSINQVWEGNPNKWELRTGNTVINISTVWLNEFNAYRISDGNTSFKIERSGFNADPIEWTIASEKEVIFYWYNEFEFDIRDWIIVDELSHEYSF